MQTWGILFEDGSETLLITSDDESLQDAIVEMCDREGWSVSEVTVVELVENHEEYEEESLT